MSPDASSGAAPLSSLVQRWGARAVGLLITGVGLYVVAPSLATLFDAWPSLADVRPLWFFVLTCFEIASYVCLWVLTRMLLATRWRDAATAQLAGNAAGRVLPGGAATSGVIQARILIQSGQQPSKVAAALGAMGLLTTGVLLVLPVLTIPAVIIGPLPPRQLRLGLLVSFIVAVLIAAIGLAFLKWTRFVRIVGRVAGQLIHLVRRRTSAHGVADALLAERDAVAAAFAGRWGRATATAAANRMLDYAALVAALYAVGAHGRPSLVLLAYVVAMALAMVPLTPGGLGFVETGMTTLLVLSGVSADQAVVGTLLYRLASYWLPIPIGALAWAGWRLHPRGRLPSAG